VLVGDVEYRKLRGTLLHAARIGLRLDGLTLTAFCWPVELAVASSAARA
jgi:hypothetical protein